MTLILAGGAAAIGALLGLISLLWPHKAARIVRLCPDPASKGGFAEFRATYGGLLLFAHLAVLLAIFMREQAGMASVIGASFAVGAGWLGAALGRAIAMLADHGAAPDADGLQPVLDRLRAGIGAGAAGTLARSSAALSLDRRVRQAASGAA